MALKSVEEHNTQRRKENEEAKENMAKTGVACPKCGEELRWSGLGSMSVIWPPKNTQQANCKKCNLTIGLER